MDGTGQGGGHELDTVVIHEDVVPGMRLGRHVRHDPRSRDFVAREAPALVSALHRRHCPPFDQGQLGSCTGNATVGLLMTEPFYRPGRELDEDDAVAVYARATHLDRFRGVYPPDDTGSSGLAAMKAAREAGWLTAYSHAFGLQHALRALVLTPVITGVNWYEGFDKPAADGLVEIAGSVRGGHEFEVHGIDVEARTVRCVNSWGPDWGDDGSFTMSWDTWDRLLHEQGDVTTGTL
ncbi:hypothetical protein CLV35_0884 [Motilibacter peucedani]|uniref:Papain like protease n=1 Tax=Motilibacter peucedani TaxID=598650 RepID=A0A420XUA6_9ACTN|nr:hypothetical protein [Motilibacter peucedani]RKS80452.1 hypothetical protein CLV35_0884 [Motilibacter peucedani]